MAVNLPDFESCTQCGHKRADHDWGRDEPVCYGDRKCPCDGYEDPRSDEATRRAATFGSPR